MSLLDMDMTSETKTTNALFLALQLGIPAFALPLALFLECDFAKEMLECFFKIAECFLWSTFRDFVEPGQVCLLQCIKFFVQAFRVGGFPSGLVFLFVARQAPIVRPTCSTRMLET